jgi:predicted nucleotidyltransferase component of viral defense system
MLSRADLQRLAEKLRTLLERGKYRDYYDVWRILKEHSSRLDFNLLAKVFVNKNKHKELQIAGYA